MWPLDGVFVAVTLVERADIFSFILLLLWYIYKPLNVCHGIYFIYQLYFKSPTEFLYD